MTRKLIILTDPGQDQAAAILMILGRRDAFDVLGLVATAGNIHLGHTINNCLKLMELAGRPEHYEVVPNDLAAVKAKVRDLTS